MEKKLNAEKDDDIVLNDPDNDLFDEAFNNPSDYSLSTKIRRKIEALLEDRKLKEELDDFMAF